MYRYLCKLVKVVDGDTIDVEVNLGFYLRQEMRLRLRGIDTPEVRGESKERGLVSKAYVKDVLESATTIGIITHKFGKYGRYVADVYYSKDLLQQESIFREGNSLISELLEKDLAEPVDYDT